MQTSSFGKASAIAVVIILSGCNPSPPATTPTPSTAASPEASEPTSAGNTPPTPIVTPQKDFTKMQGVAKFNRTVFGLWAGGDLMVVTETLAWGDKKVDAEGTITMSDGSERKIADGEMMVRDGTITSMDQLTLTKIKRLLMISPDDNVNAS